MVLIAVIICINSFKLIIMNPVTHDNSTVIPFLLIRKQRLYTNYESIMQGAIQISKGSLTVGTNQIWKQTIQCVSISVKYKQLREVSYILHRKQN